MKKMTHSNIMTGHNFEDEFYVDFDTTGMTSEEIQEEAWERSRPVSRGYDE